MLPPETIAAQGIAGANPNHFEILLFPSFSHIPVTIAFFHDFAVKLAPP